MAVIATILVRERRVHEKPDEKKNVDDRLRVEWYDEYLLRCDNIRTAFRDVCIYDEYSTQ